MSGLTVAFVDDNAMLRVLLDDRLKPLLPGATIEPTYPGVRDVPAIDGPGVALCDVQLGDPLSGGAAVQHLIAKGWRVLLFSTHARRRQVLEAIAAGARGYLESRPDFPAMADAITVVADGRLHMSQALAKRCFAELRHRHPEDFGLWSGDMAVLRSLMLRPSAEQVAADHRLGAAAVQQSVNRVFAAVRLSVGQTALTPAERRLAKLVGCPDSTSNGAAVAERLNVTQDAHNANLARIRDKYLRSHPELLAEDGREVLRDELERSGRAVKITPVEAAQRWAEELGLCRERPRPD
ncbi:response regulator transcription factor [Actinomadura graeca]|uniref:Response regulator transcription factor n=1 Tax=Actinomadura graeca TaxID=2750812 RepID=A0ABX8QXE9_9ACTN|nr:hypothetical protein [Actinomadura graeca]QXJ22644.1 response regulator transcription factor [Actinomadura graeca]